MLLHVRTVDIKVDDENHPCWVIYLCNPVFNKKLNTVYGKTFKWENFHSYNANWSFMG